MICAVVPSNLAQIVPFVCRYVTLQRRGVGQCTNHRTCRQCQRCSSHTLICSPSLGREPLRDGPLVVGRCHTCLGRRTGHFTCSDCGECSSLLGCAYCGVGTCCSCICDVMDEEEDEDDGGGYDSDTRTARSRSQTRIRVPSLSTLNYCPACRKLFHNCACLHA